MKEITICDINRLAKYIYKQNKNNITSIKVVCGKNMLKYLEQAIDKQNKEVRRT